MMGLGAPFHVKHAFCGDRILRAASMTVTNWRAQEDCYTCSLWWSCRATLRLLHMVPLQRCHPDVGASSIDIVETEALQYTSSIPGSDADPNRPHGALTVAAKD